MRQRRRIAERGLYCVDVFSKGRGTRTRRIGWGDEKRCCDAPFAVRPRVYILAPPTPLGLLFPAFEMGASSLQDGRDGWNWMSVMCFSVAWRLGMRCRALSCQNEKVRIQFENGGVPEQCCSAAFSAVNSKLRCQHCHATAKWSEVGQTWAWTPGLASLSKISRRVGRLGRR